jgi:hypothetical protein
MSHLHMLRYATRTRALMAGVLLGTGSVLTGCGGGGGEERDIIARFFSASRMGDRTTAGMIAMVAFDPQRDGTVSNFNVVNVTAEQRRPLQMRELADAVAQARADEQDHSSRMKAYQDENLEAIAGVIEAERAGDAVAGPSQEVQAAWTTWREEAQTHSRNVSNAQAALSTESQIAEVSAFDPSDPIDVRQFEGELIRKEVTINATVEKDGSSEDRTMVVTLQKVELGAGDNLIEGRWIITDMS